MHDSQHAPPLVIGIGEILWDIFPDGPRFGGAPANFACAAAQLGAERIHAGMVSAVGMDQLGDEALRALQDRRVDVSGVQQRDEPTGRVDVLLDGNGQATYDFAADSAWDHLQWTHDLEQIAGRTQVVCFGTLGQRRSVARRTISQFVMATPTDCVRLLDINLRPPHWTKEVVLSSLGLANVVKCNDEELPVIASLLDVSASDDISVLRQVVERCSLSLAVLTRGANGSAIVDSGGIVSERLATAASVVDTVGAGDSLTASVAVGLLHDRDLSQIHEWADQVAAFVCTQSGATPAIPSELKFGAVFG